MLNKISHILISVSFYTVTCLGQSEIFKCSENNVHNKLINTIDSILGSDSINYNLVIVKFDNGDTINFNGYERPGYAYPFFLDNDIYELICYKILGYNINRRAYVFFYEELNNDVSVLDSCVFKVQEDELYREVLNRELKDKFYTVLLGKLLMKDVDYKLLSHDVFSY